MLLFLSTWAILIDVILSIGLVILFALECYGFSTLVTLALIGSCVFLSKVPVLAYVMANPLNTVGYVGIYFIFAIIWSFLKWRSFLIAFRECRENAIEVFNEMVLTNQKYYHNTYDDKWEVSNSISRPNLLVDWLNCCSYKGSNLDKAPKFNTYKSKIVAWAVWWIPSIIESTIRFLLQDFIIAMIEKLKKQYQIMSNRLVGDFEEKK